MAQFCNPYHFVPVISAGRNIADVADGSRASKEHPHTHERYVPEALSGELHCRLTLVTPTVVGAKQEIVTDGVYTGYKRVHNATRSVNEKHVPVIPASSLRGMVGGVLEALTNSALRVLDKTPYSVRRYMDEALSALGMVVERNGKLVLLPLTVPTLQMNDGVAKLPKRFHKLFPFPQLRVYYGQRAGPPTTNIQDKDFPFRSALNESDFWYLTVPELEWDTADCSLRVTSISGAKTRGNQFLGLEAPIGAMPSRNSGDGIRGYMRVLGCWGKDRSSIPKTKKHELFLPAPPCDWPEVEIPSEVVKRFEELAKTPGTFYPRQQYTADEYHPNTIRNGDIVYFDVDENGNVNEISFSSLWRTRPETSPGVGATAHDFFPAELRPYSAARTTVTTGELMLGFVSEDEREILPAFASRLRFSDGLPRTDDAKQRELFATPYLPEVPLRILASPKPPCPAMYFKPGPDGRCVKRSRLIPGVDQPQGRKFYLHHHIPEGASPWRTEDPYERKDQKNVVTPLKAGLGFDFWIRFDNLSVYEFQALLSSIRPFEDFHHKLGLGKPLGLGSSELEIRECRIVERVNRYSRNGLDAPRYWRVRPENLVKLANGFMHTVPRAISDGMRALGQLPNPSAPPVQAPTLDPLPAAGDQEAQTFLWFVANDIAPRQEGRQDRWQCLKPIKDNLPKLETYPWTEPRRR